MLQLQCKASLCTKSVLFVRTPSTCVATFDSSFGDAGTQYSFSCQVDDTVIVNGLCTTTPSISGGTILCSKLGTNTYSAYMKATSTTMKVTFSAYGNRFIIGVYR